MTEPTTCSCPRCGHADARLTGKEAWGWTPTNEPTWLVYACDQCEARFKLQTPAGRRARIAAEVRHLRYLEEHGWRPDLTDDEALAMGKRLRPLYLRTRFARFWWSLRAGGRSPAQAWEAIFNVGGRSLDAAKEQVTS